MGVNKIVYGGQTKLDISNDTVTPSALLEGYTAHDNTGSLIVGTASGGGEGGNVWQDANGYLHLDDESGIDLQTKSVTPTETAQSVTPDAGYYALEKVNVGAISSSYVGSGITRRSSSDLTASGATVTAPAGYYSVSASKSVASGTAGTPTATKGTVSNHSISVTPSVTNTTGYITGGTKTGTAVTVSASELVSGSETKTANGTYDVTNLAELVVDVPVNPHTITITGSGDDTYAYISYNNVKYYSSGDTINVADGSTIYIYLCYGNTNKIKVNGTVVVSTQIASYTYTVTTDAEIRISKSMGESDIYVTEISDIAPLTVTENGTYTASGNTRGYSPVTVNVSTQKKCTATITKVGSSSGSKDAYVKYPGDTGTKYDNDGDTFVLTEGNIIKALVLGSHATCSIFVNNVEVANSGQNEAVSYNYTIPPKTNLSITLYPEEHYLNIEEIQDSISITSNGKYYVSEYDYADVNISSEGVSVDDYKSIIQRTATTPVLPSGLTSIGTYAFRGCNSLALTSLPDGVTSIGTYAFHSCAKLALTSLPSGVTVIGSYAFYGCKNIALTSLPSGVTSIGTHAFYNCANIEVLSIPSGVSTINSSVFSGCNKLETIILRKTDSVCSLANVSALANTPIRGYNSLTGKIYVPSALIESYKTAANWSTIYNAGTVEFLAIEGSEYEE